MSNRKRREIEEIDFGFFGVISSILKKRKFTSMKCPKCQADVAYKSRFCPDCGTNLTTSFDEDPSITRTVQTTASGLISDELFAERYKIEKELGRGGMGIVYKAQDTKLKRPVALKLLPLGFMHLPDIRKRFLLEAQAAAALDHSNICTVYESDEADGRPYMGRKRAGQRGRIFLHPARGTAVRMTGFKENYTFVVE